MRVGVLNEITSILVTKFYQPFANLEKVERSAWSCVTKAVDCHEIVMTSKVELRVLKPSK